MATGDGARGSKPSWFKVRAGGGETYERVQGTLGRLALPTVCQEARCPNRGECWGSGTATFLLLGPVCTRSCRFCHVSAGKPDAPRPDEPEHVARAAEMLGLRYVVLTMVDRDDLPDGGARHVANAVRSVKATEIPVEALVGDFGGRLGDVDAVLAAGPDVFGHNLEVTERLGPHLRDRRSSYRQSLDVLRHAKRAGTRLVKSSLMLGLGESREEVLRALRDLREAGVDIVTVGQYARPSAAQIPVVRWVTPPEFDELGCAGKELGFALVASGPLVRSSYRAAEGFVRATPSAANAAPANISPDDVSGP